MEYIFYFGDINIGKMYIVLKLLKKVVLGSYLVLFCLLVLEVFEKLNKDGVFCLLKIGEEEKIVEDV